MDIHFFEPKTVYILTAAAIWSKPGSLLRPGWLVVEGGRISAVGQGPSPRPENALTLDLKSFFLAPGMIDAHVHLALNPGGLERLEARVDLAVQCGLVGVRDGGDKNGAMPALKKTMEHRLAASVSGAALFRRGRYGAFIGQAVENIEEIKLAVRERAEKGADQIKILASGPVSLDEFGKIGPPQFTQEELEVTARAARDCGLELMVHANGREAVTMSVRAGAASIEHGYFMGTEALAMMADTGCVWIPTIEPLAVQARRDARRRGMINDIIDHQVNQLAMAESMGVKTALGTDAGSPGVEAGPGFFREIAWWKKAGFDTTAVLTAATERGIELMNGHSDFGSLAPGKAAHLPAFEIDGRGNPVLDRPPRFVGRPGKNS